LASVKGAGALIIASPLREGHNYGDLLFIAATNFGKKFRAFDKLTGHLLWETVLPAAGNATPSIYEAGGRQYIVIVCGGGKNGAAAACADGSIHRPNFRRRQDFALQGADELVDLLCALFHALRLADLAVAPQAASFFQQFLAVLRSAQMHVG
jgi:hypothetical protein